ncbi:MAG: hypothetical protein ACO1N0_17585 [Fluviicola sp.]
MIVMFNEKSFLPQPSVDTAKEMMKTFVDTYIRALKNGINEIRIHENFGGFYHQCIAINYLISQWVDDPTVDKPLRTKFRTIAVKSPLISESEIRELDEYSTSEFSIEIDDNLFPCFGLGASFLCETLSISFNSRSIWDTDNVPINHFFIDEELNENKIHREIKHFSKINHFDSHIQWLEELQKQEVQKGQDLWEKREQLFPFIILCGVTESQFCNRGYSKKLLTQVKDRLQTLNKIGEAWKTKGGSFDYTWANENYDVRISPESETTMNRFSQERRFQLPNGTYEIFELHLKTGNLRFHFFPDNSTQTIYVGYIGKHLQVSSEN